MDKTKPDEALSGRSIANRIVAKMKLREQRKVVSIKNLIVSRHDGGVAEDSRRPERA